MTGRSSFSNQYFLTLTLHFVESSQEFDTFTHGTVSVVRMICNLRGSGFKSLFERHVSGHMHKEMEPVSHFNEHIDDLVFIEKVQCSGCQLVEVRGQSP